MKRFFKPKGKDDKPIPYPLDLPPSGASSFTEIPPGQPPYGQSQPRRLEGFAIPQQQQPQSAGDSATPRGSDRTGNSRQDSNDHGRRHVLQRPHHGSRDGLSHVTREIDPGGGGGDEDARVRRRTSLKGDGKLFGWTRKDKEREKDPAESQRGDEQWTVIPPPPAARLSSPVTTIPEARDSPTKGYYLPPGAQPPDPIASLIPPRPYPTDSSRPRTNSGGRDYLSGRSTAPLAPRSPQVDSSPRSESPYGYGGNVRDRSARSLGMAAPLAAPLPMLSPPPALGRQSGSENWSPASSEQELLLQQTHSRNIDAPGGYGNIRMAQNPAASSEDDLPTPIYARQMESKDSIAFIAPRPAPRIPTNRQLDGNLLNAPGSRDNGMGGAMGNNPAVVLSAVSSPASADMPTVMGHGLSQSISPGNGISSGDERKRDKAGRFFGLGVKGRDKEKDRAKTPGMLYVGSSDDYAGRQSQSLDMDARDNNEAAQRGFGGGVVQPVTVVEPMSKKERDKAERAERDRRKEAHKREKEFLKELEKKEREGAEEADTVGKAIADLCHRGRAADFAEILLLCERVAHSPESVAKDAARAVRKELKQGDSEMAKVTAAKIWLLGCTNSAEKGGFRSYATDKKFMATVQEILSGPAEKEAIHPDTYERIRDTLAHLNYNYGSIKGCELLRSCWNKIKTSDEPEEGYPLASSHPVYSTHDRLLDKSEAQPAVKIPADLPPRVRQISSFAGMILNEDEEIQRLVRECVAAKEHARVLHQALAFTTPGRMDSEPVIEEFYNNCVKDQMSMVSQMGWASAQADRSRDARGVSTPIKVSGNDAVPLSMNEPGAPLAEKAFAELLEANAELTEVLRIHDEMAAMARVERDTRLAKERSKTDTRMERNRYDYSNDGLVPPPGINEGSSSRSPSPKLHPLPEDNQSIATHSTSGPKSSYLHENRRSRDALTFESGTYSDGIPISRTTTPDSQMGSQPPRFPTQPRTGSPTRLGHKIQGPRPLAESLKRGVNGSASSLRNLQSVARPSSLLGPGDKKFVTGFLIADGQDESDLDDAMFPAFKPTAKALGKRPAMITNGSSFDPDDIWKPNEAASAANTDEDSSSEDDFLNVAPAKSVVWAYDAYHDQEARARAQSESKMQRKIAFDPTGPNGSSAMSSLHDTSSLDKAADVSESRTSLEAAEAPIKRKPSARWKKPWRQS